MTIYVDIIMLENICMNYIIIITTAFMLKTKIKYVRFLISSVIGAAYSVLLYMNLIPFYSNLCMKIFLSIIMTYIAFNPKNIKIGIKQIVIFYLVSFLFGGCAFALLYFIKPENIIIRNGVYIGSYPIKIAFLGAIVGFTIMCISFKVVKNRTSKKEEIYKLKIKFEDNTVNLNALLDTGNLLKDPISGMPVIIIEKDKLYNSVPKKILDNLDKVIGGDMEIIKSYEVEKYISKIKFIPYNSIGRKSGIILGLKPDNVIINIEEEDKEIKDVIIGIYNNNFDSKYDALIGIGVLEKIKA